MRLLSLYYNLDKIKCLVYLIEICRKNIDENLSQEAKPNLKPAEEYFRILERLLQNIRQKNILLRGKHLQQYNKLAQ